MKVYQRQLPHLLDDAEAQQLAASTEDIPPHELQQGLSMLQICTIARHYWKQSAVIAAGILLIAAVVIKWLPKTYTATATLIVNSDRQAPLAGQQAQGDDLGNYVTTQTEIIMSPIVLLPVVDRLKLTQNPKFIAGFSGDNANELREFVGKELATAVQVQPGTGGQLLYVAASAGDPTQAATIANAVADVYLQLDRQRANDPVTEEAERSSQELADLRAKVTDAQDKVTAFRQSNGLTNLVPTSTDTEMQGLATLETRLLEAQNQRRSLEAQQAGQVANGDEALASNHIGVLKDTLATLQARLAQLRPTLGPRHPEVLALEAQISATEKSLRGGLETLSDNVSTQLSREKELETELTQAVANQRAKVLRLRGVQDEGTKLQLELESAQSVYKQALDGYDQVKFAAVRNFANVSLISRATPPVRPAKPNKIRLLGIAAVLALGIGLAVPFLYELWIDRRLRCRDDLERGFGIRVLAQLDPVEFPSGAA